MISNEKIRLTEQFVRNRVSEYDSSHDWWHTDRVRNLAANINSFEKSADPFTVEIASLLHDYADSKFSEGDKPYTDASDFLAANGMEDIAGKVLNVMKNISFSKVNPSGELRDPAFLIIQDADRLDAIGAIGIARAFNYGGYRNNPIWIQGSSEKGSSTIAHFYDKLLLLKDMMNTDTGKDLARERHAFLEIFLSQFHKELNIG